MKTIHKVTIPAGPGVRSIKIRKSAILRHIDAQDNQIALWYEVDTFNDWIDETFMIMCTGDLFDKELYPRREYIDTVLFKDGSYVLHVYKIH